MLDIWVIYDHPIDFPTEYVARRYVLDKPTEDVLLSKCLEGLRSYFEDMGLTKILRDPSDDPCIVESWL